MIREVNEHDRVEIALVDGRAHAGQLFAHSH